MILVDTHVHIHRCFDLNAFLDAAAGNFKSAAASVSPGSPNQAVLCLTEAASANAFDCLTQLAGSSTGRDAWSLGRTGEAVSLTAAHPDQGALVILAGRQIRCAEGIEVLALGTTRLFADGLAAHAAIDLVHAEGAVPVLPWGFGKWTGRRGRVVRQVLENRMPGEIALGDNSGRPAFWREPAEFVLARGMGFRILPGSDPLPFAAEVGRVASYGLAVPGQLSDDHPARDLLAILSDPTVRIQPYGRRERWPRFVRNQLAMQFVKRRPEVQYP